MQLTLTSYSSPFVHATMPTDDHDCQKAFSSFLLTLAANEVLEKKHLPAHVCTVAKELPLRVLLMPVESATANRRGESQWL